MYCTLHGNSPNTSNRYCYFCELEAREYVHPTPQIGSIQYQGTGSLGYITHQINPYASHTPMQWTTSGLPQQPLPTKEKQMTERKYLPTLSEKLDRLCITQLKELLIVEHKEEYAKEIADIVHDIDLDISEESLIFTAKDLRALIVLVIMNREIWLSESAARNGKKDGSDLLKSHSLNSLRNQAKNKIQEIVPNSRKDYKIDVLTKEYIDWTPSWDK